MAPALRKEAWVRKVDAGIRSVHQEGQETCERAKPPGTQRCETGCVQGVCVFSRPAQCLSLKSIKSEHHHSPLRVWASAPPTDPRLQLIPSNTQPQGSFQPLVLQSTGPFTFPLFLACHVSLPSFSALILWPVTIITPQAPPAAVLMPCPFSTCSRPSHKPGRCNVSTYPTPAPKQQMKLGKGPSLADWPHFIHDHYLRGKPSKHTPVPPSHCPSSSHTFCLPNPNVTVT